MTIWYPNIQIAAGHNNAAGLVAIESITPSSDIPFVYPLVLPNYDPGAFRVRGDGLVYASGYRTIAWRFAGITIAQVRYLQVTYCASGYSGKVTLRTRLDNPAAYANYNAIMNLPKPVEGDYRFKAYADYTVTFTRLVAL